MTMDDSTEKDDAAREAAIEMLTEGMATPAEVARLSGASRQLLRYWIQRAGIDPRKTRDSQLAKAWRKKVAGKRAKK